MKLVFDTHRVLLRTLTFFDDFDVPVITEIVYRLKPMQLKRKVCLLVERPGERRVQKHASEKQEQRPECTLSGSLSHPYRQLKANVEIRRLLYSVANDADRKTLYLTQVLENVLHSFRSTWVKLETS